MGKIYLKDNVLSSLEINTSSKDLLPTLCKSIEITYMEDDEGNLILEPSLGNTTIVLQPLNNQNEGLENLLNSLSKELKSKGSNVLIVPPETNNQLLRFWQTQVFFAFTNKGNFGSKSHIRFFHSLKKREESLSLIATLVKKMLQVESNINYSIPGYFEHLKNFHYYRLLNRSEVPSVLIEFSRINLESTVIQNTTKWIVEGLIQYFENPLSEDAIYKLISLFKQLKEVYTISQITEDVTQENKQENNISNNNLLDSNYSKDVMLEENSSGNNTLEDISLEKELFEDIASDDTTEEKSSSEDTNSEDSILENDTLKEIALEESIVEDNSSGNTSEDDTAEKLTSQNINSKSDIVKENPSEDITIEVNTEKETSVEVTCENDKLINEINNEENDIILKASSVELLHELSIPLPFSSEKTPTESDNLSEKNPLKDEISPHLSLPEQSENRDEEKQKLNENEVQEKSTGNLIQHEHEEEPIIKENLEEHQDTKTEEIILDPENKNSEDASLNQNVNNPESKSIDEIKQQESSNKKKIKENKTFSNRVKKENKANQSTKLSKRRYRRSNPFNPPGGEPVYVFRNNNAASRPSINPSNLIKQKVVYRFQSTFTLNNQLTSSSFPNNTNNKPYSFRQQTSISNFTTSNNQIDTTFKRLKNLNKALTNLLPNK